MTARPSRSPFPAAAAVLLASLALAACETAPVGTAPPTGGTAQQAHTRVVEAYNQCNTAAFVGSYAPSFSFTSSTTKHPITSRDELQRYLAAGCTVRPNPTMAVVQQSARSSGNVTVLAGQLRVKVPVTMPAATAAGGGVPPPPTTQLVEVLQNFTLALERSGERWLVLAHHLSVAP